MSAVRVHCVVSGVAVYAVLYCTSEWLAHGPVASVSTGHFVCTRLPATIPCDMHETYSLQAFCGSHGQPNRSSKRGNLEEGDEHSLRVSREVTDVDGCLL